LFSSILAAFIIGSTDNLEGDKEGIALEVLLHISQQLHNASTIPYRRPSTEAPIWAVRVNCYLYLSLGLTLSSAFISVLALQWIRSYDLNTSNRTDPRERALFRQFRFQGLKKWHLSQIISILPGLIHIALLLFFMGLIEWLFQTNRVVAYVMLSAIGVVALFYLLTQVAAATTVSAPFRTPISQIIEKFKQFITNYLPGEIGQRPISIPLLTKTYQSREEQVIVSDKLLPLSALMWLLNRQLSSQWSSTAVIDVLEQLTKVDDLSLRKSVFTQSKVQWSAVFDKLSVDFYRLRLEDKTYPPHVQKQFFVMLEASILVGGENLSGVAQSVLMAKPFSRLDLQSSPLGLLCRFALRRSGKPFYIDSGTPPIELYRKICQKCTTTSPLLVLCCLQDLEALLSDKKIDIESIVEIITSILRSPDEVTGIVNLIKYPELRSRLLALGLAGFGGNLTSRRNFAKSDEQLMLSILDLYDRQTEGGRSWSTQHSLFITAMAQQLLFKMATTPPGEHTLLQLEIIRHPSLKALWMHESGSLDLRLVYVVQNRLWGPTRALYPPASLPAPRWAQELCNSMLLMLFSFTSPPDTFGKEWEVVTTALSTLALCMSTRPIFEDESLALTSSMSPKFWLINMLQRLKPAMAYPSTAFVISAMLSGPVRSLLSKGLNNKFLSLDMDFLKGRGSTELSIVSYMLLGLEYSDFIPPSSSELWDSPSFAVIVKNWRGFQPTRLMKSDVTLIRIMSRCRNVQWAEEILAFLATRKGQIVSFLIL
jgi:hypothetical protein